MFCHSNRTVSETKTGEPNSRRSELSFWNIVSEHHETSWYSHLAWAQMNEQDLEAWAWPIDVPNLQSVGSMLP